MACPHAPKTAASMNSSKHAKRQLSQYSKLGRPTVIVDGQKFTEREILLRYGTVLLPTCKTRRVGIAVVFLDRQFPRLSLLAGSLFRLLDQNQALNFVSELI
jgi:hypothetical protein